MSGRKVERYRAFSLIELLVVVGIIVILIALAAPALNSILGSGRISQAANQVISTLSLATQRATAENRAITVRIIAADGGPYRHIQLVEKVADGSFHPLDRIVNLPDTIGIATSTQLSSFFELSSKIAGATDPDIPSFGSGYRFIEFQIRPDGRLALDVDKKWFLTVIAERDDPAAGSAPPNFATIQIDPVNGGITVYRP